MSTITYLTSLVQQAISRLNNYEANAKKVDELPHQTSLNTNSKIPVSRAGVSEYITVDQIASAIQNGNYNQLLTVGSITVNELTNEIIVASGVTAQINGSIYQTTSDTTIPITLCPAGFTRKDILVLTTSNTVIAISGEETDGAIVLAPPTPLDAIYITEFDVNDTAIGTPSDPILGGQFKQKTENQSYNYSTTGSNVILPLRGEGQNHYIVDNEDLVSVDGFDKTVLILVRNSEAPYEGKDYLFENKSPNSVELNHLTSAEIPFSLPNEENLIVPAGGAVWFKYKSDVLVFIMKSWNDPVISNFKGKFTSKANLDAAFPTATDGDYAIVDAGTGSNAVEYIWDNEEGWVLGNSVGASTTDALVEGSTNLYFQTTRVLATALSGLSLLTGGDIVSTDTVLQAFGKLQKQINDLTSGKLDKVTTVDVEKVYIKKADGTQDVKATSELVSKNTQIFHWWGGNWTTTTLGNYYYIGYNGGAIEGPTNTISGSMNGRNKGLFIAPFNCKIKRVMFKEAGSGTYTGSFVLASGLPNYGGTWNNGYSNVVTHLNSAITSAGSNQNKFEYLVTDNITVPKGYAVCPMLVFSAQGSTSKLSIEISVEIEEVV